MDLILKTLNNLSAPKCLCGAQQLYTHSSRFLMSAAQLLLRLKLQHLLLYFIHSFIYWFIFRGFCILINTKTKFQLQPLAGPVRSNEQFLFPPTWRVCIATPKFIPGRFFFLEVSILTLHDNTCVWSGSSLGRLDVTLITFGWKKLLATGRQDCGGHCHTQ